MSAEEHLLFNLLEECVSTGVLTPQCHGVIQDVSDRKTPSSWTNFFKRAKLQFAKAEDDYATNIGLLSLLWILRQFATPGAPRQLDKIGKQEGNEILSLLTRLDPQKKQELILFCELVGLLTKLGYLQSSQTFPLYQTLNRLIKEEKWDFIICLIKAGVFTKPDLVNERAFLLQAVNRFIELDFSQQYLQQIAIGLYPQLLFASALLDEQIFADGLK